MRFRGILFLATLAVVLSPGAAALADEQVLTFDFNDAFFFRPFGLVTAGVAVKGYSFEATTSFEGFQLEFCGASSGTPTDDIIFDLYTASEASCEFLNEMSCRDTLVESAVFTFVTPDADWQDSGATCDATEDTGVVVLAAQQAAGEYSINIRRSGALDDLNFWRLSAGTAGLPAANGIDGVYTIFNLNPQVFADRAHAANLTLIADFVTPNLITLPDEGETITAVPFQIQGSCDQAEEPNLRVVITHADLGFIEERIVVCLADSWAAPDMGAALFNDDFIVTLFADNFVELPFDTHNFTVDEPGNPTPGPPGAAVQCSGVSNLFLEGLCDILTFLFVPNSETIRAIDDLFDELRDKPPIGFLTVALDAFDTLEQGVSSEELEGTAGLSNFFDPIKTTFSALLWMLFAVFLIRRVSTIRI